MAIALIVLIVFGGTPAGAFEALPFSQTVIASKLDHPSFFTLLPDGGFLVAAAGGGLVRLSADGSSRTAVSGLPADLVLRMGKKTLFDAIPDPGYAVNHVLYLSYAAGSPIACGVSIIRARLDNTVLSIEARIFTAMPLAPLDDDMGGRMAMMRDGTILIVAGDRGDPWNAGAIGNDLGKVVRMGPDGATPADNPFILNGRRAANPRIYTYGHRAPQGLAVQPDNGAAWIYGEDPPGRDELNRLYPGLRYGWAGTPAKRIRLRDAELAWLDSIQPSGMVFWRDSLIVSGGTGKLRIIGFRNGEAAGFQDYQLQDAPALNDIRTDENGSIYVLTDGKAGSSGQLIRLDPK